LDKGVGFFLDGADNDVEFDGLEPSVNLGACCWGIIGGLEFLSITRGIDLPKKKNNAVLAARRVVFTV